MPMPAKAAGPTTRDRPAEPTARPAALYPLFTPLEQLPGVGPKLARQLARLVGRSDPRARDLVFTAPVRRRDIAAVEQLSPADEGRLIALDVVIGAHRPALGRAPYRIHGRTGGTSIDLVFFNAKAPYLERRYASGTMVRLIGRPERFNERWQLVHPEPASEGGRDATVYRLIAGLGAARLKRLIAQAMAGVEELAEWHEPALLARDGLPGWRCALATLHGLLPADQLITEPMVEQARRRLALDELMATQLALALVRQRREARPAPPIRPDGPLCRTLLAALPFAPTGAQARAMAEITGDLATPHAMSRLLMGDVGSGKTLVALNAMLAVVDAGHQAALMAPTEVLARQHAASLQALAQPLGIEIALLAGGLPAAERRRTLGRIAEGTVRLVVGTHALFQEGVAFRALALAVIDEQHRFGVGQRLGLVGKGGGTHLLLMTATPIPRSLVLSAYGDIRTSRLDEKPPGRQPITTVAIARRRLDEVIGRIAAALGRGERAYWICPSIAPDEAAPGQDGAESRDGGKIAAETRFAELRERLGPAVGLVHGRLKPAEKVAAMADFAAGRTALLVATTVIEVGVDVPEATIIVIEGAEQFGLAQLHQLRGRVGRGSRPSFCVLLHGSPLGAVAKARLEAVRGSDDGFFLAEEDLRLRGPGEVLGYRQSGLPELSFADLATDGDLVALAQTAVEGVMARDPQLEGEQGRRLRLLLHLFERYEAVGSLAAG